MKILLLAHNELHLDFFLRVKEQRKGVFYVGVTFPTLRTVDVDFYQISEGSEDTVLNYEEFLVELGLDLDRLYKIDRFQSYFPWILKSKSLSRAEFLKRLYLVSVKASQFLVSHKIAVVFSELIIGSRDFVISKCCDQKDIPYIGIRQSKFSDGIVLVNPHDESLYPLPASPSSVSDDVLASSFQHYMSTYNRPNYTRHSQKKSAYFYYRYFYNAFCYFVFLIRGLDHHYITIKLKYRIFRIVNLIRFRKTSIKELFQKVGSIEQPFFLFPLQFEPEATVLSRGYPYTDQIGVIEEIARGLPDGHLLLVKEHIGNEGYRDVSHYFRLHSNPKVVLIDRQEDNDILFKKCCGVITISGMMGFEAMVRAKPVFCLGSPFWRSVCPNVMDLNRSIADQVNMFATSPAMPLYSDLFDLYSSYLRNTFSGTFLMLDGNSRSLQNIISFLNIMDFWCSNEFQG